MQFKILQSVIVDADDRGQKKNCVTVCITANSKKPLTKNSLMKRMVRVFHNFLDFT